MRAALATGGLVACGVACFVLGVLPGVSIPPEAACAAGGALAVGGLLLWSSEPQMEA